MNALDILGMIALAIMLAAIMIPTVKGLAKSDTWLTFVPESEIKFIVAGESVKRIIVNVKGWYLNERGEIVEAEKGEDEKTKSWLNSWFGLWWVSIFYPLKQVHHYDFEWDKLTKKEDDENFQVEHRSENVKSLRWKNTYPIISKKVELKDNLLIDITILATIRVVKPVVPIFVFKGNWLIPVSAKIQEAINYHLRGKDMDQLFVAGSEKKSETGEVLQHELDQAVEAINVDLGKKFGVEVDTFDLLSFDFSASDVKAREAVNAKKIAILNARKVIEDAKGDAGAIRIKGKANAAAIKAVQKAEFDWMTSAKAAGGKLAVIALMDRLAREKTPNLTHLMEKGAIALGFGGQPTAAATPSPTSPKTPTPTTTGRTVKDHNREGASRRHHNKKRRDQGQPQAANPPPDKPDKLS